MSSELDQSFLERLSIVFSSDKNISEIARKAGLSRRVVDKYRRGESDPSRARLIALAKAADVSVRWLATGEGPMKDRDSGDVLDEKALTGAIRIVETWLALDGSTMKPDKKAVIIAKLYAYVIDEDDDKAADPQRMAQIFKLVANQ